MRGSRRCTSGEDAALRPRAYAPKLEERSEQCSTLDHGRRIQVVSFRQTHRSIPIFGARATVELDDQANLVAARAKLGRVDGVSETPQLRQLPRSTSSSHRWHARYKASTALRNASQPNPPPLTFFHDRAKEKWHLAYVFSDIPSVPAHWRSAKRAGAKKRTAKATRNSTRGTASSSPRERFPRARLPGRCPRRQHRLLLQRVAVRQEGGQEEERAGAKKQVMVSVRGRGVDEDGVDQN